MAFELSPAAQAKLASRKARYVTSLRDKHREIEQLAKPVVDGATDAPTLDVLREAVHKLAGSAGLYGFGELQSAASELDLALLKAGNLSTPLTPRLSELIDDLLSAFDLIGLEGDE